MTAPTPSTSTSCRVNTLIHKFVDFIPGALEEGILYVSLEFGTVSHLCCCGCRRKTVTPLGPTDWKLIYDGDTISLSPSIGNWCFPCRSHYFITNGRVAWCEDWSDTETDKDILENESHVESHHE